MNINEAKTQICNAMRAYFQKDEFGNYVIPIERQRPIFLMGPPGIGKTAIMEQIASELDVGLVSYSMTHHTRQSALGLPFIEKKTYGGREYSVSEYTMSEIIASVYDMIEDTGLSEGILFLDEINCVSETLAPSMLQFLQYKIFGKHRVPAGWVVVTAGNPPEYNNSVREFDIVTWDRLKRMDVEPSYDVWKEYAYRKGTHAAIMTYLDIKKDDFYRIETDVNGKIFVTARGWSDLSDMMKLYEGLDLPIDETLIAQYLQYPKIAKEFAIYYDLFRKYRSDYQIPLIAEGKCPPDIRDRARNARFDERLALIGLLLDHITDVLRQVNAKEAAQLELLKALKAAKVELLSDKKNAHDTLTEQIDILQKRINRGKQSHSISSDTEYACRNAVAALKDMRRMLMEKPCKNGTEAFALLKSVYDGKTVLIKAQSEIARKKLSNIFKFCEETFGDGQEILIFVTELTISYDAAHFISCHGCKEYFAHNKELLFYERQKDIIQKLENLDL